MDTAITSLLERYRSKATTPREVIFELRNRAEAEKDYNAWIYLLNENELDRFLASLEGKGMDTLPLYGIPFAVKDNIDLAGIPTTAGCPDFEYVPDKSAFVVEILIEAGAIPLGKTNLDQFATGLVGTRPEPAVSVPSAKLTKPKAVAMAEPELLPPLMYSLLNTFLPCP